MRTNLISFVSGWLPGNWLIPDPSLMWLSALAIGIILSLRFARRDGLDLKIMTHAGLLSILGGLWGGHLMEVLATPRLFLQDPLVLFRIMEGGKAIIGAILGGTLLALIFLYWKKASILNYVDTAMPAIALSYAIGRLGCFLNGCCFGVRSDLPWAVKFPEHTFAYYVHWGKGWLNSDDVLSLAVHPTQLYHAIGGFMLFLVLHRFKPRWSGGRLVLGLAGYGFLRFFLQLVRGDRTPIIGILDINQILSLIFVLIAGLLWWRFRRKQTLSGRAIPASPTADAMQLQRM